MAQVGKLYKFYLKKIFKKNWLRITIASLFILVVVWFGVPYLAYKGIKNLADKQLERVLNTPGISDGEKAQIQKRREELTKAGFSDVNKALMGKGWNLLFQYFREKGEGFKKHLEQQKEAGASEKDLREIRALIQSFETAETFRLGSFDITHVNADNSFFFNRTEGYNEGKPFWKLLNNISLWNLGGFFISFFVIYNVLDNTFLNSKKDGEEQMVLNFTPGVTRSDLFFGKLLAFLTFYAVINIIVFLLPYGFYYFWTAPEKSFAAFSILSLYTVIIGPLLYFGLILAPYIFFNSLSSFVGYIFFTLLSFFPTIWLFFKMLLPPSPWIYKLEGKFLDPAIFTVISVIFGIVFLSLYHWKNQEEDLGN